MVVQKPERMSGAFAEAFNAGNVDELLSLYEANATYIHGTRIVTDPAVLREIFKQLTASRPTMRLENEYCVVFEDTALVRAHWRLEWRDAAQQLQAKEGHSSEVLRRGTDGYWRYIIDHPTGGD